MNHRDRVEQVYEQATNMLEQVNLKLKSVDETEKVKNWLMLVIDEQLISTKKEVIHAIYEQSEALDQMKSLFKIPGIIGDGCTFPNVKDYLESTFITNKKGFIDVDKKLEDLENTALSHLEHKLFNLN